MEPIKNALAQAGNLVQQAAHSVVEVLRGGDSEETHKDQPEKKKEEHGSDDEEKTEKNIDSKQKKFEQEQQAALDKSDIPAATGGYHDPGQKIEAKVLATSWPELKGKTRHDAEEAIKAKGYGNIKVMKKGTSSSTDHDESRVILYVDEHEIVVEEPRVG